MKRLDLRSLFRKPENDIDKKNRRTTLHIIELVAILLIVLSCVKLCGMMIPEGDRLIEVSSSNKDEDISLSPEQIRGIENIGQWVFLRIEAEEMVHETKKNLIFKDDELMRIYRGTLMLGFDLKDNRGKDWIRISGDTLFAELPKIRLLDENFINEARTTTFFQEGKWNAADLKRMHEKAYRLMRDRNLTEENIGHARDNAENQMRSFFSSFGYRFISISFKTK